MIYLLLFAHWLGDFVFQTDEMAKGKSKSYKILARHIWAYMLPLWAFCWVGKFFNLIDPSITTIHAIPLFVLANGGCHFVVDAITSRITSKLWIAGRSHDFFAVIGFDQLLHGCFLIWTGRYLGIL